jgi:hypothetical protein
MDPQIIDSITVSVDKLQKIVPLFLAAIAALYVVYLCAITESLFIIKSRLSDLINSKHTFNHEKLKKYQQQELDLHYFNFKFKLNVKTPYAMDKLIAWAERSAIQLDELKKARPYLNPTEQTFNIPKPRFVKTFVLLAVLVATGIFFAIYTPNAALTRVNKTGQWFWVTDSEAFSFTSYLPKPFHTSDAWSLNSGNCLLDTTATPLSDDWDKKVICYVMLGNKQGYVKNTIQEQKILAGVLSLPWLIVILAVFQESRRRRAATELLRRSQKKLRFGNSPLPEYVRYYHD